MVAKIQNLKKFNTLKISKLYQTTTYEFNPLYSIQKMTEQAFTFFLQERTKEVKESNLPSATSSSKKSSRSTTTAATIASSASSNG